MEDTIVLPGVDPDALFDPDRDWELPGTSDAIADGAQEAWQLAATHFASQYNRERSGE